MDFESIITAIGSFGFPIVMCVAVCFYVKYIIDKNAEQLRDITKEHKSEVAEMTKAIENNTLAITKLLERLSEVENG